MAEEKAPIYVIKKKIIAGGHHGGAWKVAYADFVTAMMALFIVLWLLSSSEEVQKAVGGYFQDPTGNGAKMGSTLAGSGDGVNVSKDDMSKLKEKIEGAMKQMPKFNELKNQVKMVVTGEGLRIELLETEDGMFFENGKPRPSESGDELLRTMAEQLSRMPNKVLVEGHTDARPFAEGGLYSNWELSTDRANAARRIMMASGLRADQIAEVRGFADQRLRKPDEPGHASNRRISVIVKYLDAQIDAAAAEAAKGEKAGAKEGEHSGGEKPAEGHGAKKAAEHH